MKVDRPFPFIRSGYLGKEPNATDRPFAEVFGRPDHGDFGPVQLERKFVVHAAYLVGWKAFCNSQKMTGLWAAHRPALCTQFALTTHPIEKTIYAIGLVINKMGVELGIIVSK